MVGSGRRDEWSWRCESGNGFSVATVRSLLRKEVDDRDRFVMEWSKWVPNKCQIFVWRAEMNRIPTLMALRKRNIGVDSVQCILCEEAEESADHLFSACGVASGIWSLVSEWCKVPNIYGYSVRDIVENYKHFHLSSSQKRVLQGILMISCWRLWKARNEKKFSNKPVEIEEIFGDIKAFGFLWFKYRAKMKSISWHDWCSFNFM